FAVGVLLAGPITVWAADEPLFPKGAQDFSLAASYAAPFGGEEEFGGEDEQLASVSQAYGYNLFDNFVLVPKLTEHYVFSDEHDSVGLDFTLSLRWHFIQCERWTFFVQGGGGFAYFTRRVPEGTTNFNFVSRLGPGFTYLLEDNCHLIGGVDWLHISNAEIAGAPRHGGLNSAQFYLGLLWTF
ncbi:MAG: acyloxyacyl hydrolase, partial [Planctomycetaceae bacterium]|nr:acyloxyacyl hydrolase [Planctomycetaceae bacterium]